MEIYQFLKNLAQTATPRSEPNLSPGAVFEATVLESDRAGPAVLQVGGRQIKAVMSQYIEPGQKVSVEVVQANPRLVLRVNPEPRSSVDPPPAREGAQRPVTGRAAAPAGPAPTPNFTDEPQGVITARVVRAESPTRIKIEIVEARPFPMPDRRSQPPSLPQTGREMIARLPDSSGPAKFVPGQEIRFTVQETAPQLVLKIAPPTPPRPPLAPLLTAYLNQPDALPQAAEQLGQLLTEHGQTIGPPSDRALRLFQALTATAPTPAPAEDGPDLEFLPRMLRQLGLEGPTPKIKQEAARFLSEILQKIKTDWTPRQEQTWRALIETAVKIFDSADQTQHLGLETWRNDGQMHLAFPLFWDQQSRRGEALIQKKRADDAGGEQPLTVSLLLDLTRIGKVKIDAALDQKQVSGAVFVQSRAVKKLAASAVPALTKNLTQRGFRVGALAVRLFPGPPPETLAPQLTPRPKGLIDVKI